MSKPKKQKTIEERVEEIVYRYTAGGILMDTFKHQLVHLISDVLREVIGEDTEPLTKYLDISGEWRQENEAFHRAQNMLRQEQRRRARKLGLEV